MIVFLHNERPPQMLIKVTARQGDDLWILTNGELLATPAPTSLERALRYLTPENGWTMYEAKDYELQVY